MANSTNTPPSADELANWMPLTTHTRLGREGHMGIGDNAHNYICRCSKCTKLRLDYWEQQAWIP